MELKNRKFLLELEEHEIEVIHEALNNAFACEHSTQMFDDDVLSLRDKFVKLVDKFYLSGEAVK